MDWAQRCLVVDLSLEFLQVGLPVIYGADTAALDMKHVVNFHNCCDEF